MAPASRCPMPWRRAVSASTRLLIWRERERSVREGPRVADPVRVLFVCTGNLCRSPLAGAMLAAEAEARALQSRLRIDSAGTHARHGQECPPPLLESAGAYGLDLSAHRSRRLTDDDFFDHDVLVALDLGHLDHLNFMRPRTATAQQGLLLSGVDDAGVIEVPDPFGRGPRDYARAASLIQLGVRHLLTRLLPPGT